REIAQHVHEHRRDRLLAIVDLRRHLLERRYRDGGHADHDRSARHLRQRGRRVPRAYVGGLAERVELRLLQRHKVSHSRSLHEAPDIHDERRSAVGEYRGAAEQRHGIPYRIELLHYDVLLPRELVHHETRAALPHLEDDYLPRFVARPRQLHQIVESDEREDVVAHGHHLPPPYGSQEPRLELHRLVDVGHRYRVDLVTHAREERPYDRQREGEPKGDGGPLPLPRADLHRSAHGTHPVHHRIYSHAAARDPGHALGG